MFILVFSVTSRFPGYASENKNKAHKKEDEQGGETISVRLITLSGLAFFPIVDLIRFFVKGHGLFLSINTMYIDLLTTKIFDRTS